MLRKLLGSPTRDYVLIVVLFVGLVSHYFFHVDGQFIFCIAIIGAVVPFWQALLSMKRRTITIETFNAFALLVSFLTHEYSSAAFIGLMLAFASLLDWITDSRATNAVEELLKLKPTQAYRERDGKIEEIASRDVLVGDIIVVKSGERVPVDGEVVFGETYVNESSLTGESKPIEKKIGDLVYSSTLSTSGVIKLRATKVGSDSTIERMARLIEDASKNKSRVERLADKFAGVFLPLVILLGVLTYVFTKDIRMTAAFFLVVCADDIAVSIPLAVTATLGRAAKRGVIIKGGEWVSALAKVRTLALDKTGTLTYGNFALADYQFEKEYDENTLWRLIGSAEKYSEHPTGKALVLEALLRQPNLPDPTDVKVIQGAGITALVDGKRISIGNEKLKDSIQVGIPDSVLRLREEKESEFGATVMMIFVDGVYSGMVAIADKLREEAKTSMVALREIGVEPLMLTGDNAVVAKAIAGRLGIQRFLSKLNPEGKLVEIERLVKSGKLAMVGDGINDAPALARADVGIAMGKGGTAVAVEAANIVILTDNLDRIPEMIILSRKTVSVINGDMAIWVVTNVIGIVLVFTGIASPAIAALYNFLTDFLPLLNSMRLFKRDVKNA
jgi:Cd2+/Zn2+-exporting ATPase